VIILTPYVAARGDDAIFDYYQFVCDRVDIGVVLFNTEATYPITARFDNIGGLKVRAPVRSAGVTVGRVTDITLDGKTYQGVVSMDIRRGFQFPKDSSAKILTAGLLGDQYVGLEPGADEANLAPGATIRQTQSALVLENLIGQLLFSKAAEAGDAGAKK